MTILKSGESNEPALLRCGECDRETRHYNTFLSPTNGEAVICWECLSRKEKGFNAKAGFRRSARSGQIPR
jgi:hypothetical protein